MGRKWGRGFLLCKPVGFVPEQKNKTLLCTARSAVAGDQPLLKHFLGTTLPLTKNCW